MIDREKLQQGVRDRAARRGAAGDQSLKRGSTAVKRVALPSPVVLGAPSKFKIWRLGQAESVLKVVDSTARTLILCLPTGAGKSLTYMIGAATYMLQHLDGEGRMIVLTSTKLLMDQLTDDMKEMGIVDLRGLANYGCVAMNPGGDLRREYGLQEKYYTCEDGMCHGGVRCELKNGGCKYFDRWREARNAKIVISNYQKWFAEAASRERDKEKGGIGEFDIMILDEAHKAEDELCSFLGVKIKEEECRKSGITVPRTADGWTQDMWKTWARAEAKQIRLKLEVESSSQRHKGANDARKEAEMVREMKRLAVAMEKIGEMKGRWIIETEDSGQPDRTWRFDPVWATDYAERFLFQNVPKVILSSATARLKTAELLGLKSQETELYEQDSIFPKERRPIIHVNCAQMNHRNEEDEEIRRWITGKIDKIINARLDRKGIIHTRSYKRRNYVLNGSRWNRPLMVRREGGDSREPVLVSHERRNVRTVVEKFKSSLPPRCLISPSVSTGHDFAYDQCEYNIIMKVPFPDTRDAVTKKRCEEDPEYGPYVAAQEIVQAAGRGMRAEDDVCETLILDDNMKWFVRKFRKFFPEWFLKAYYSTNIIPVPPKKLKRDEEN